MEVATALEVDRFYDPGTATFTTRDPLNAMTRSAYGYVDNNPLNGSDPSGLFCIANRWDLTPFGQDCIDSKKAQRKDMRANIKGKLVDAGFKITEVEAKQLGYAYSAEFLKKANLARGYLQKALDCANGLDDGPEGEQAQRCLESMVNTFADLGLASLGPCGKILADLAKDLAGYVNHNLNAMSNALK